MLKKWFHILLSAWLINSVVWYQTPATIELNSCGSDISRECLIEISSLLGTAVHILSHDHDDTTHSHKIKYRSHYVANRLSTAAILVPAQLSFLFKNIPTLIKIPVGKYNIRSCFLPAYYNFLFRLSPF